VHRRGAGPAGQRLPVRQQVETLAAHGLPRAPCAAQLPQASAAALAVRAAPRFRSSPGDESRSDFERLADLDLAIGSPVACPGRGRSLSPRCPECEPSLRIRKPDRTDGNDVATASTDTTATTAELIARYDSRWTIETAHQEAKAHGVGQARNRVRRAVERTVPFGFLRIRFRMTPRAALGPKGAL